MMKKVRMIGLVLCCYLCSLSLMEGVYDSNVAVGTWGRQKGDPDNIWSFELAKHHRLAKITIDHGDVIYSLMFTTEHRGNFQDSDVAGGWYGGDTVTEVILDSLEYIIGINGTVGTKNGFTVIKSLSFQTSDRDMIGPFGRAAEETFSLGWDESKLAGFYGFCGSYIDGLGVYLEAWDDIVMVGRYGRVDVDYRRADHDHPWSFKLDRNHHLENMIIGHGDLIHSLMFTSLYKSKRQTTGMFGGMIGGQAVSQVVFDSDEAMTAIKGTIRGSDPEYFVISSLSFVTNKTTHGPFGNVRGEPFTLPWAPGYFYGFYGLYSNTSIDRIGVYLRSVY